MSTVETLNDLFLTEARPSTMAVLNHTEAQDVTGSSTLMENVRKEVAGSYSRLGPRLRMSPEEALRYTYGKVCTDEYDDPGRSRTIAALTSVPETGLKVIAGTVRLINDQNHAIRNGHASIEALKFYVASWPHRKIGIPDYKIGELSRFVINQAVLKDPEMKEKGIPVYITRMLYDKSVEIAKRQGVEFLYAIMPSYVVEVLRSADISMEELKDAQLNYDDPKLKEISEYFKIYWQKSSPKLFRFII